MCLRLLLIPGLKAAMRVDEPSHNEQILLERYGIRKPGAFVKAGRV